MTGKPRCSGHILIRWFGIASVLLAQAALGSWVFAADNDMVGSYVCQSMNGKPCDSQVALRLLPNGYWGWGKFSGKYVLNGAQIDFIDGNGGPVTWGSAAIGKNTLTFDGAVVFARPLAQDAGLLGRYQCTSSPGGCQTRLPIDIDGAGHWKWGGQEGAYQILSANDAGARQIQFRGLSSGPAGWGPALIGAGSITFRTAAGPSVWTAAVP
jgi:hypothetical protein